jgi:hypothetical protein
MNGDSSTPSWYYSKAGVPGWEQVGPLSWEQLQSLAQSGALSPVDSVWNPQLPQWTPAAQIQGLFAATSSPGVQPPYVPAAQPGAQWAGVQPAAPYAQYPGQPAAYLAPRRRSWLVWAIPVTVLVLAALGLGLGLGLTRDHDDNGTTVSSRTTTTRPGNVTTTSEASTITTATATVAAGTREDPLPLGQETQMGNWRVRVVEATLDATEAVLAASSVNDKPDSGSQYVLVKLEATNTGTGSDEYYSNALWTFVGSASDTFSSSSEIAPDDLYDVGDTPPGGTASGNVLFLVDSSQVSGGLLMIKNMLESPESAVYFAIQ